MCTEVIMPLQATLTSKSWEFNSMINTFWPKTPQQSNKFRPLMQDKSCNKKRRHQSEKSKYQNIINKSPTTPNSSLYPSQQHTQSSPFYAGAKFSEAPLPSFLPKPPISWLPTQLDDLNNFDNLNQLNDNLKKDLNIVTRSESTKVIQEIIPISKQEDKNIRKNDKFNENGIKPNQSSSKYYSERKFKSESVSLTNAANSFQYNFRNTRRNTPQCQTKCKNTRYSSFPRQSIHQKIAAVN